MGKIGIFSGTFDPVHKGHIAFALQAMQSAELSEVYFLPERLPWRKQGVTHYAHRVAMLKLALKPYKNLHVLELPDRRFTVAKTLPRLKGKLDGELYFLMGSDTFAGLALHGWPEQETLLKQNGLIVGRRLDQTEEELKNLTSLLPAYTRVQIIKANNHMAASSDIRSALSRGKVHGAHLQSLTDYIKANWLYVSAASIKS